MESTNNIVEHRPDSFEALMQMLLQIVAIVCVGGGHICSWKSEEVTLGKRACESHYQTSVR